MSCESLFRCSHLDAMVDISRFMATYSVSEAADNWVMVPFLAGGGVFMPPPRSPGYVLFLPGRPVKVSNVIVGLLATLFTLRKLQHHGEAEVLAHHERMAVNFYSIHVDQLRRHEHWNDANVAQIAFDWLDSLKS